MLKLPSLLPCLPPPALSPPTQLMADIRAGRCFSWLEGDEQEGCSGSGGGGQANGASKALQPPPAEVAAAVDARLGPNTALADELQQVGHVTRGVRLWRKPGRVWQRRLAGGSCGARCSRWPERARAVHRRPPPACSCLRAGGAACWSACSRACSTSMRVGEGGRGWAAAAGSPPLPRACRPGAATCSPRRSCTRPR